MRLPVNNVRKISFRLDQGWIKMWATNLTKSDKVVGILPRFIVKNFLSLLYYNFKVV